MSTMIAPRTTDSSEEELWNALRQVWDPELNCNIVDLGLVYEVSREGERVGVVMTLTTPGCPMHDSLAAGVERALLGLPGVSGVDVRIVWDPPWSPLMMTDAARQATGLRTE